MDLTAWEKKTVTLDWAGLTLPFRVAQELFSSHDIDQGTKLLLRSLDLRILPEKPVVLDFGCGYGPLGLALKAHVPAADVELIDRDALAVEFTRWNAREFGMVEGVEAHGGLDPASHQTTDGYNLILWNVPGKAGAQVLRGLIADVAFALRPGGMLALVVVNPLADLIRDTIGSQPALSFVHDQRHTAHTVVQVICEGHVEGAGPLGSAFDRGIFDRRPVQLARGGELVAMQPVVGLPEYDGPDFTSELLMETVNALFSDGQQASRLMALNVGIGHAVVHAMRRFGAGHVTLVDRDLLALLATRRNLIANGVADDAIDVMHAPSCDSAGGSDLVLARLDAQLSPALVAALHGQFAAVLEAGSTLIVGGPSTSVSRFLKLVGREKAFKERSRQRSKGVSAATLTSQAHQP